MTFELVKNVELLGFPESFYSAATSAKSPFDLRDINSAAGAKALSAISSRSL